MKRWLSCPPQRYASCTALLIRQGPLLDEVDLAQELRIRVPCLEAMPSNAILRSVLEALLSTLIPLNNIFFFVECTNLRYRGCHSMK